MHTSSSYFFHSAQPVIAVRKFGSVACAALRTRVQHRQKCNHSLTGFESGFSGSSSGIGDGCGGSLGSGGNGGSCPGSCVGNGMLGGSYSLPISEISSCGLNSDCQERPCRMISRDLNSRFRTNADAKPSLRRLIRSTTRLQRAGKRARCAG